MNQTLEREAVAVMEAAVAVEDTATTQLVDEGSQTFSTEDTGTLSWKQAGRHALMNTRKVVHNRANNQLYMRTAPARDAGAERLARMRRTPR
ncbi:hypothetical protein DFP93_10316 [Aneurinibacillus soli]|uniref:Uncharacterized protein n=1 Tax=Aneurinibacillus soli TaxID=1500254 RepID=A0A0U5BEK5_9BACL|nr:hypothetical protein [Aneurinibacillus soli]PYE62809.1 hypothetical protein DFP93_10316 [Aneurinibacillus soli]BAU29133.1 hypothetical protein CB4_03311 [Aneurinibacillus soli]